MRITVPPVSVALEAALAVVDGYHDVPTADAVTNTHMRDVAGNKTDAVAQTPGDVYSAMAYLKGLCALHDVPVADAVEYRHMRDSVGVKSDAAQTTVGTTRSLMGYLKGVLNQIAAHITALATHDGKLDTVDGLVDNLEAERLQRAVGKAVAVVTSLATYADVVNITDKGVLTGITSVPSGTQAISLRITIDGGTPIELLNVTANVEGVGIAFNHRFDTSLQVEHKLAAVDGSGRTICTYTVDA